MIHGLDDLLKTLKSLPPELASKRGGPVAAGLRAGAKLVAEQARVNVRAIVAKPNKGGRDQRSTQALEKAIGVRRDPNPRRSGAAERMIVGLKRRATQPKTDVPVARYGSVLEFGSEELPAERWLRGAMESKQEQALRVIVETTRKRLDSAVKKARKGRK